ncbi:GntR family transcriptional regulator/MocR family aminotransferase [Paenibacillus turicensis]|uniref:GntR family transcriptional regulator/MocR family aminotransferase n=1 Tax=Paenibacillus turicensis TaxID=160487 RepID=A0ABS4FMX4_9BACL|nr:PLP-dependent aminotransferase family protein [Paenibacillus turicensis]MBP1903934.1 GntR family transcriptional regulator/MocR family aminotransferase [Paenibacillus turicensis]
MHFQLAYSNYLERYSTKIQALYHAIRDAIVSGLFVYGDKLPSSRELAAMYEISRGTVNQVYDMLASQGYLSSIHGSGTFVAYRTESTEEATHEKCTEFIDSNNTEYYLSSWGKQISTLTIPAANYTQTFGDNPLPDHIDFSRYAPDLTKFPYDEWNNRLYAEVRAQENDANASHRSLGDLSLREAISAYLRRMRGIVAQPEQIAVTAGSMQAIALLTQLLADSGDHIVAESPCYEGISLAIKAAGATLIEAGLDGQGLVPKDWNARMLFVTPSRQFPTGEVLSLERRQTLLQWASKQNAVIVEDDYDSEFRYRGVHVEPLKTLDKEDRVIYLGSFTKTLPLDVRLGYVVLPLALADVFRKAQALYEPKPINLLEQRALAAFMNSGQYERHLRRMNRLYSRKFKLLFQLLTEQLSNFFDWIENDAGLHIFGWWKRDKQSYDLFALAAKQLGVFFAEAKSTEANQVRYGIILAFAHLTEDEITEGVRRLTQAMQHCTDLCD